ncbi:MAG: hypothetical protein ACT4P9_02745 [Betaproteobacteria bacterium]
MNLRQLRDLSWMSNAAYNNFRSEARENPQFLAEDLSRPAAANPSGPSTFTKEQADAFTGVRADAGQATYTLLWHEPNTSSGFSATVFRNEQSGETTLAVRGTEFNANLFNLATDLLQADVLGVGWHGVAKGQLADAFRLYKRLITPEGQAVTYTSQQLAALRQLGASYVEVLPELGGDRLVPPDDVGIGALADSLTPMNLTGHSLGGHVALMLGEMVTRLSGGGEIGQVATFNAPGVGGPQVLQEVREWLGIENVEAVAVAPKVVNVFAEKGMSFTAGLGGYVGTTLPAFIESVANPISNHSMVRLTDALAIYDAFGRLAPELGDDDGLKLLEAVSAQDAFSLESALDALRLTLLGPGSIATQTVLDQREALYQNLYSLLDSTAYRTLAGGVSLSVLVATDAATLAGQARFDFGHFLAVHHLLPFALEGASSVLIEAHPDLYARWSADRDKRINGRTDLEFTDAYLADRAQMLSFLSTANSIDVTVLSSDQVDNQVRYSDLARRMVTGSSEGEPTNLLVFRPGSTPDVRGPNVVGFGTDSSDLLPGRENNDHLYGGPGADTLTGAGGADRLEGGAGADKLHGGAGFDTYLAGWGDTITDPVEASPGGEIYLGPDQIRLTGGTRKDGERWFTGTDSLVYWERSDGAISVFGPNGAAPLLITPPGTQVPGLGAENGNVISGRPDLGIRLVTERAEGLGSVAGSGDRGAVLALWDLARTWRPFADPLALDLDGDGFETIGNVSGEMVLFDHAGGGVRTGTGWLTGGDAWLALDRDGDGLILSGAELFGVDTPMPGGGKGADGFAALRPLDTNGDGAVDDADAPLDAWQIPRDLDGDGLVLDDELAGAGFADLVLWRDENLNGFSEPFELTSLAQAGITRIRLDATADGRVLGGGNRLLLGADFERSDGTTGRAGALDLVRETFLRDFLHAPAAAPGEGALPNVAGAGEVRDLQEAAAEVPVLAEATRLAASAPTGDAQRAAVSDVVDLWAGSSGMATGTQAAFERQDQSVLYYVFNDLNLELPWASQSGSFQLPDEVDSTWFASHQSAEYQERVRKLEVLERFTGQTYADVARQPASVLQASDGRLLHVTAVSIGAANWAFLEQAYGALVDTTYQGIAIQTRLDPYVLAALRGQSSGNFDEVESLFESRRAADALGAIGDLADLARAVGVELVERGWIGLPVMLERWLREARADPVLAPGLEALGIRYRDGHSLSGTGGGDILLGSDWTPPSGAGARMTEAGIGNDLIFGAEAGETTLSDGPGRDIVMGGPETNLLVGGPGRDIYLFGTGSGRDSLQPDAQVQSVLALDRDVLQFLSGVRPEDVTVRRAISPFAQFDAVEFRIGADDVFTDRWFAHQDTTENDRRLLDGVRFADGTIWTLETIRQRMLEGDDSSETATSVIPGLRGFNDRDDVISGRGGDDGLIGLGGDDTLLGGAGNDTLEGGAGNDVLDGGPGNDVLYGGFGTDAYVLGRGGGSDLIIKGNYITFMGTNDVPGLDVIRVADGIGQDEVLLQRQAGRLRILLADGSAELLDTGNPLNPNYDSTDGHAPGIGRIEFADGSSWDAQAIRERSLLGASGGADTIVGFHGSDDTLRGLAGDDTLVGLGGNDVLDGGLGVDRLEGGLGADTYVWRRGDGFDDIVEDVGDGMVSTLRLPDATLQDLHWNAESRELTIAGESLRLASPAHLWQLTTSDGATVELGAIPAPPVEETPSDPDEDPGTEPGPGPGPGGPPLPSTSPTDGSDFLVGTIGPDRLAGGRGDDVLLGGPGSDTYYFARGDGVDFAIEMPEDAGTPNRIQFGPGIALQDLTAQAFDSTEGTVYLIYVGEGDNAVAFSRGIETLQFDDGASIPIGQLFPALAAGAPPDPLPQDAPPPESSPPDTGPIAGAQVPGAPDAEPVAAVADLAPQAVPSRPIDQSAGVLENPAVERPSVTATRVGVPLDPLYREMTERFDVLLQVGRANLSERYAEAVREFEERRRQREAPEEPPPPTEREVMEWNRAMHAWHDRHPGFGDVDGVERDGVWAGGWGTSGGERSFDDLLNVGNAPSLASPAALPRLGGAARSPGLSEGIRDIR